MSETRKKKSLIPIRPQRAIEEAFIHGQKKGTKQTVSKTIRVTPGEFKAVQQRAIDDGIPYSDVIRAAICKYLAIPFDKDAGAR